MNDYTQSKTEETNRHTDDILTWLTAQRNRLSEREREHLRLQEKWNELQREYNEYKQEYNEYLRKVDEYRREYNEYEQEYLHSQEDFGTIICILPLCVWVVGFVLLLLVSLFI